MPVKATFFDAKPRLAFRPVVEDLMGRATRMDVAVAFITKAGVDLLCKWAKLVEPKNCRVCVSGQFPTDLAELVRLHKVIGDQLHIHLRSGPEEEVGSSRLSPLFPFQNHLDSERGQPCFDFRWEPQLDGMCS